MGKFGRKNTQKIAVAMSGGVDSSVAATLLKRDGFDIVGFFLKLVDSSNFKKAENRAKKTAEFLKIPFMTLDLRKEFKKRIINPFFEEYKKGLTPNPCVVCNKEIKFGFLPEKALKLKADYLATGHYVRLGGKNGKRQLFRAGDTEKDQSYFLWQLNQRQLKKVIFPLGNYNKKEVRNLTKKFKLPAFNTPESQEVCFIQTAINDFLKKHLKSKPGDIINTQGKVLGRHQGLWFYTIGQRRGIKLSGGPFYVLDKYLKKNILIVTKNKKELFKKELIAKKVNWISGKEPKLPLKAGVKIRYRHRAIPARVYKKPNAEYKIQFDRPQQAITPGQSAVIYKNKELLGGGIIC